MTQLPKFTRTAEAWIALIKPLWEGQVHNHLFSPCIKSGVHHPLRTHPRLKLPRCLLTKEGIHQGFIDEDGWRLWKLLSQYILRHLFDPRLYASSPVPDWVFVHSCLIGI